MIRMVLLAWCAVLCWVHFALAAELPDDPELAAWTLKVERVYFAVLELRAIEHKHVHDIKLIATEDERKTALSVWKEIENAQLPADDHLRMQATGVLCKIFWNADPLKAAEFCSLSDRRELAAGLYRKAGRMEDAERALAAKKDWDAREKALQQRYKLKHTGRDVEWFNPPQKTAEWLSFYTTGPTDPFTRGCESGFSSYAAHLSNNLRVRRALTLYYMPCRDCGLSPVSGELYLPEPMLRTTAGTFPNDVARLFSLLIETEPRPQVYNPFAILGDAGPTPNALWLFRDVIKAAPESNESIQRWIMRHRATLKTPVERARWRGLLAYLQDGAPDIAPDDSKFIAKKLAGSDIERRWALAWIQRFDSGEPAFVPDLSALGAAAEKCVDAEDTLLALNALQYAGEPCAWDYIVGRLDSPEVEIQESACIALSAQMRSGKAPAFTADVKRKLQSIYPLAKRRGDLSALQAAIDGDDSDDAETAARIERVGESDADLQYLQFIATRVLDDGRKTWTKTIAAFKTLRERKESRVGEYAGRVCKRMENP